MSDLREDDWELPDADESGEWLIKIDKYFFGDDEEYRVTLSYTDDANEITSAMGDTPAQAFAKIVGELNI
jgi:hypothetical protein